MGEPAPGCTQSLPPPIRTGEPTGVQLMRIEPGFSGAPFRVLLDFESPSDLSFISDVSASKLDPVVMLDSQVAHTGGVSLQGPGGAPRHGLARKLPAVLPQGGLPNG